MKAEDKGSSGRRAVNALKKKKRSEAREREKAPDRSHVKDEPAGGREGGLAHVNGRGRGLPPRAADGVAYRAALRDARYSWAACAHAEIEGRAPAGTGYLRILACRTKRVRAYMSALQ